MLQEVRFATQDLISPVSEIWSNRFFVVSVVSVLFGFGAAMGVAALTLALRRYGRGKLCDVRVMGRDVLLAVTNLFELFRGESAFDVVFNSTHI